MPNRDDAWALLCEWTPSEALRKHALGVEAAMRAMAAKHGGNEALWGMTGLLHDFDYERYPTVPEHATNGSAVLREKGYPEEVVLAILGHASYTGVPRETPMAKALFACDDVQPDRKIASVKPESAKKKLKDKSFARGVNREEVIQGAQEVGADLLEHITFVRDALVKSADTLGL